MRKTTPISRFSFAALVAVAAITCTWSSLASGQAEDQPPPIANQPADADAEQPADAGPQQPAEAQQPGDDAPADEQPSADAGSQQPADVPADEPDAGGPPTQEPAPDGEGAEPTDGAPGPADVDPADQETTDQEAPEETEGQEGVSATREPQAESAPAPEAGADAASRPGPHPFVLLAVVIALFVVPIWLGNVLARRFRMPDHSWRISLASGTIAAAIVVVIFAAVYKQFRGGPDLVGGITLIYEVEDPDELRARTGQQDGFQGPTDDINLDELIGALTRRINPAGTKEITIRKYGAAQVEIIVPLAGPDELEQLKDTITNLGELEFRIVANGLDPEQGDIIRQARELLPHEKELTEGEDLIAMWVPYDVNEFGPVDAPDPLALRGERDIPKRPGTDRRGNAVPETLVLIDDFNVTGGMLESTWADSDQRGRPAVSFRLDAEGATQFGRLTSRNLPNQATGMRRYLGILLNRELLSAPSINSRITDQGIIEGDFSQAEVESLVNILNAGSLPAALNPEPLSEKVISPTLGAATVRQGAIAIVVSMILVLLFMLFYYRFAGIVACMALVANLMLVLATMVLLKADFTLPGLAGLVLTIGMSVDANVLIFERIREELARGAAFRMAIRNGFDKAKSAIYDANVTTLLTGIVLFWIDTDEIKGFATTLIIGIIMSVYTAVFCSRIIFDIAERRGWKRELKMMQIVGATNIDFLGMRYPAIIGSLVLIGLGLVAVAQRGTDMLNIDFMGGVSASMVLEEGSELTQGQVTAALSETDLGNRNLLVVEEQELDVADTPDQRRFMVYAHVDAAEIAATGPDGTPMDEVEYVQDILKRTFAADLATYAVEIRDLTQIDEHDVEAFVGGTEARIVFNEPVSFSAIEAELETILPEEIDGRNVIFNLNAEGYAPGSAERFTAWDIQISVPPDAARPLLQQYQSQMDGSPLFPMANVIHGQVASDMQKLAALAVFFSLLCIIGYIWLRFQQVMFGLAAVIAVVHDVLVAVGLLALSAWVVNYIPPLATALQLEPFQISLQVVAALLTLIGYSLNDTIVIFDRIREVRGKSPHLTREMVNTSLNQTLSRTLLTSFTTFLVVVILYLFGGAGIHAFAFSLVIGIIAGTYSTVFIACPALLWMSKPAPE